MSERDLFDQVSSRTSTAKKLRCGGPTLPREGLAAAGQFSAVVTTPHSNPLAAALVSRCPKHADAAYVDTRLTHAPHHGRTVRRDCARCGWTLGFPEWYGEETEGPAK